jgi:long-chain acyl-CoA synthetase
MATKDMAAYIKSLSTPPAPGVLHGVSIPGSERPGRSAIYRHHKIGDGPLLTTFNPEIQSVNDLFEAAVKKRPGKRCLGTRHWNVSTQAWQDQYEWETYAEVAERRKNLGAGLVDIHKSIGHNQDKYGVGLWSQNRAEWQITGRLAPAHCSTSQCQLQTVD